MQNAIRRTVRRSAFCGLAALSLVGFRFVCLFEQAIWQPEGLRRFLVFRRRLRPWFLLVDRRRPAWSRR